MKLKLTISLLVLFLSAFSALAQGVTTHKNEADAKKSAGQGVTFKIPEKVMPMEKWNDFKGLLMLGADGPWGIFISYPNEGETLDSLKSRLQKSLAKMFIHDDAKTENAVWKTVSIPAHEGDKGETAVSQTFAEGKSAVQLVFYEREWNGLGFVYGYFAMKNEENKGDSGKFLDEKGKGSKPFDNFWKTFPKK